jgi:hypothetical protein
MFLYQFPLEIGCHILPECCISEDENYAGNLRDKDGQQNDDDHRCNADQSQIRFLSREVEMIIVRTHQPAGNNGTTEQGSDQMPLTE